MAIHGATGSAANISSLHTHPSKRSFLDDIGNVGQQLGNDFSGGVQDVLNSEYNKSKLAHSHDPGLM